MGFVSFLLNCVCPGLGLAYNLAEALIVSENDLDKARSMVEAFARYDTNGNNVRGCMSSMSAYICDMSHAVPVPRLERSLLSACHLLHTSHAPCRGRVAGGGSTPPPSPIPPRSAAASWAVGGGGG